MEIQSDPRQDRTSPVNATPDHPASAVLEDPVADAPASDVDGFDQHDALTPRQMRLLAALVSSTDVQAACQVADVGRTAAYEWMKQPAFQNELKRQRNAVLKDALSVVKISATRASTELVALLDEDDASLRRLVCRDILDRAIKIYDMEDIETRLAAVERSLKQNRRPIL